MGNESVKTIRLMGELELEILSGDGIDIGCGSSPITGNVTRFDRPDGDANEITKHIDRKFDFVFSCHCLEHMRDPGGALQEWWQLVREGGHLMFVVPDEDLYEQGYFPSLFNSDHNFTFTIKKNQSWSPKSCNIMDLIQCLDNYQIVKIELQDNDYRRDMLNHSVYSGNTARWGLYIMRKISGIFKIFGKGFRGRVFTLLANLFRLPIDQTSGDAVAQIAVILKKGSASG